MEEGGPDGRGAQEAIARYGENLHRRGANVVADESEEEDNNNDIDELF
jgi:hypothetical protein